MNQKRLRAWCRRGDGSIIRMTTTPYYFLSSLLQCSRSKERSLSQLSMRRQLQDEPYIPTIYRISISHRNDWIEDEYKVCNSCSAKIMSTWSAITDTIIAYFVTLGTASFFLFINTIICNRCHQPQRSFHQINNLISYSCEWYQLVIIS